jgi:hypothetical protein
MRVRHRARRRKWAARAEEGRLILRSGFLSLLLCVLAVPAFAFTLNGSSRTTAYAQKSRLAGTDFNLAHDLSNRTRLLETLRLDALALGRPTISFHTEFTADNIVTNQSFKETRTRLYRAYLQDAGTTGVFRYDARLGRQYVAAGVGAGVVDGVSLRAHHPSGVEVTGFFGTLGADAIGRSRQFWKLEKPGVSNSFGGQLRLKRDLGLIAPAVGLSVAQVQRSPHETLVTDAQRLGIQGEVRFTPKTTEITPLLRYARAWGELRRDLVFTVNTHRTAGVELISGRRSGRCWVEYNRKRPTFPATSYFSSFDSRPVHALRGGVGARVYSKLELNVDGDLVSFQGNESEKGARLMLSCCGVSLGYRLDRSYGGDLSGLILYGHHNLGEKLIMDASVNYTQYKYGEIAGDSAVLGVDDNEAAGVVAASYRLRPNLTLTGQVAGLRNARFNHDVRVMGSVNWRFRTIV